ncbi:MAG: site-2 protease family protein [Gammaproteobacteria bacterium]|nr:site-2 protease family protein [Gammaproteobacteria bacterium]
MGEQLTTIQIIAVAILPVLFAITVHEVAHGWMAKQLGDRTAQMLGRLTLNPIKHIDPVGTLLVPGVLMVMGAPVMGWAKPVPVNWENLGNPRRDIALVAVAGPMANLLMAIFWLLIMKLSLMMNIQPGSMAYGLFLMADIGISINLVLMVLNLLPILPLDGGRILTSLLPGPWAWKFSRLEPYGLFIVLGLFALGVLSPLIGEPVSLMRTVLYHMAGL